MQFEAQATPAVEPNSQAQNAPPTHAELLAAFDDRFGDAVEFDAEIDAADAVDWISEFAPLVRAALVKTAASALKPTEEHTVPVCRECGSESVVADAAARWSTEERRWEVSNVFDNGHHCDDCDAETRIDYKPIRAS